MLLLNPQPHLIVQLSMCLRRFPVLPSMPFSNSPNAFAVIMVCGPVTLVSSIDLHRQAEHGIQRHRSRCSTVAVDTQAVWLQEMEYISSVSRAMLQAVG